MTAQEHHLHGYIRDEQGSFGVYLSPPPDQEMPYRLAGESFCCRRLERVLQSPRLTLEIREAAKIGYGFLPCEPYLLEFHNIQWGTFECPFPDSGTCGGRVYFKPACITEHPGEL